jgi:DNA-binding MarR family transcriptional regulator
MNRRSVWSHFDPPSSSADPGQLTAKPTFEERESLRAQAARERYLRSQRRKLFNPHMFGEPAWDILLALCEMDDIERRLSIAQLATITHVPLTTSLRWLSYLEDQDLVSRSIAPHDHRMVLIELTDEGRRTMENYFREALGSDEPQQVD